MPFRTAFFAFPNEPPELKGPIMAANELIKTNDNVRIMKSPMFLAANPRHSFDSSN